MHLVAVRGRPAPQFQHRSLRSVASVAAGISPTNRGDGKRAGPRGAPRPTAGRTGARCRRGPVRHRSGGRDCTGRCSASPPSGAAARPSRLASGGCRRARSNDRPSVPQTLSTRSRKRQRVAPFGEFVGQIAHQRAQIEAGHQGRHLAHDHRAGPEQPPAPGRIRPAPRPAPRAGRPAPGRVRRSRAAAAPAAPPRAAPAPPSCARRRGAHARRADRPARSRSRSRPGYRCRAAAPAPARAAGPKAVRSRLRQAVRGRRARRRRGMAAGISSAAAASASPERRRARRKRKRAGVVDGRDPPEPGRNAASAAALAVVETR